MSDYLLLFSVQLEALGQSAGLWLVMLLSVQIHALCIRNVLLLGVAKQTVGTSSTSFHSTALSCVDHRICLRFELVSCVSTRLRGSLTYRIISA